MWGREMRAGLAFVLASLLFGGAFRDWKRSHEARFSDLVESLESRDLAARDRDREAAAASDSGPAFPGSGNPRTGPGPRASRPVSPPPLRAASIDINRATSAELERLPGIGPALAARIVADRRSRGPYPTPNSLLRVPGIGARILGRILPYLAAPRAPADSGSPIAN